jgi:putative ATPase
MVCVFVLNQVSCLNENMTNAAPSLFADPTAMPLAEALRPQIVREVIGQDEVVTALHDKPLRSLILWGPPGCGKTTLARLLAQESGHVFESLSAVFSGVGELRQVFERARAAKQMGKITVVFVDEIHRFNKSQQDAFLPVVEDGTIILIGATTENPSFELNAALLSRCPVYRLQALDDAALELLLQRAETILQKTLPLAMQARTQLKTMADGDGRYLLTMVDMILAAKPAQELDCQALQQLVQKRAPLYDKAQEAHYNLISALHKAVRGSDVDASLYWLARMLAGGEDPHFIARRMVRMASEDIGMADPNALTQVMAAWQGLERLGVPEGELLLSQAIVYLATAPKSNAIYVAHKAAQQLAAATGSKMPPKHAVNAPTKLMKESGYGAGYIYDHDTPDAYAGLNYFPDEVKRVALYTPPERGFEREIVKRLAFFNARRKV